MNKPRWPLIAGISAIVIVIVAAIGITTTLNHRASTPTSSPTTTQTSPATPDAAPTGCLGGTNRDNTMLVTAQKEAPHSTTGAVEFAAAFVRWTFRHPTPTVDQANEVAAKVIATDAAAGFQDLGAAAAANQNPSGGAVADGTDFYVSTAPGVWYLDKQSSNQVTVSVGAGYVIAGALNPQLRSSSTFELEWQAGGWHVKDGSLAHTTEELFRIGTPFSGGC